MDQDWFTKVSRMTELEQPNESARDDVGGAGLSSKVRSARGCGSRAKELPAERDLVERFGLARNTLRKLLDQLEAKGFDHPSCRRGTLLRNRQPIASLRTSWSGRSTAPVLRK